MPKILVVFTGGTIGCSSSPSGNKPRGLNGSITARGYELINAYLSEYGGSGVEFETAEPLRTLSENMTAEKWNALIAYLKTVDFKNYNGIVITHGTDTLAYTASLLGILLSDIDIPVTLVSSHLPLSGGNDNIADGYVNFNNAVHFILREKYAGVFVVCSYNLENPTVFISTRIKQCEAFTDRFEEISGVDFGYMLDGRFVKNPARKKDISLSRGNAKYPGLLNKIGPFNDKILMIQPHIGLDYSVYNVGGLRAVLHTMYHSFTCCTESNGADKTSVTDFIKRCGENDVLFFFAPFNSILLTDKTRAYTSTEDFIGNAGLFIKDVTVECAFAKLMLACSLFGNDKRDEMMEFLDYEFFYEKL